MQTLGEALASEQTAANNMVVSLDGNGSGRNEPLKLVASPITMDAARRSACAMRRRRLGEHATEILGELGYAPDRIAALRTAKVLS